MTRCGIWLCVIRLKHSGAHSHNSGNLGLDAPVIPGRDIATVTTQC